MTTSITTISNSKLFTMAHKVARTMVDLATHFEADLPYRVAFRDELVRLHKRFTVVAKPVTALKSLFNTTKPNLNITKLVGNIELVRTDFGYTVRGALDTGVMIVATVTASAVKACGGNIMGAYKAKLRHTEGNEAKYHYHVAIKALVAYNA